MKCNINKKLKLAVCFVVLIVVGILSVAFPVDHTNPPVTGEIEAPEEVMAILRRACYDCHSNETKWPWYSYVAPVSWLVSDDVQDGRKHMNFSIWDTYNEKQKRHKTKECGELVEEGEMPLWFYIPLHPKAELLPDDVKIIVKWSKSAQ